MRIRRYKKILLPLLVALSGLQAAAQQGLGPPVLWQHFGIGDKTDLLPGPALPAGTTGFTYSTSICPPPGHYTILRRVNINGCFSDEWIPLSSDYNSDYMPSHADGNMMLVNYTTQATPVLLYVDTIRKAMCPGTVYLFNARYINLDRPAPCELPVRFPVFAMNIENESGQVLFTDTLRNGLAYANPSMGYKFTEFGINFTMPNTAAKLVARITVIPNSAVDCAEDFAIDDIKVSPQGPRAEIRFPNEPAGTTVKSVCYQHSSAVLLSGVMDPFYTNPALQWQQTTDNGITWTDIPGATTNDYTGIFSVPDTFLFRLSGGELDNMTNPGCRIVSNTLKVEVNGIPGDISVTSNSPVCSGQPLKFYADGGAAYNWTGPNGFYDNIPFPQIYFSSLADSGMYYVDIITRGGCLARDSTLVKMIGIDVDAWPDTAVCKGELVQLQASPGMLYEWTPVKSLSNPAIMNPRALPDVTTVYTVKVTGSSGCSDTAQVEIKVRNREEVKAVMEVSPHLCRSYDSLLFREKSRGKIESWYWEFGNGIISTDPGPGIQYFTIPANQDSYMARLAVTDTAGCSDTAYQLIRVEDNCYIAVPSAFTPNNDGKNDYLYPLNAFKVTGLVFRVYNRNGRQVFESHDWTRKWDGRVGGVLQTTGVYVWMLDYTDVSGKRVSLKGTTVLIR